MSLPRPPSEIVQIEAPCSMEAGYTFMANYGDRTFPVTVPPGGVVQGQLISVPFPGSNGDLVGLPSSEVTPFIVNNAVQHDSMGLGFWKDNLLDCGRFGLWHPSLWNAFCCPQILMAQILVRFKMNWCVEYAPNMEWKHTFPRIVTVVVLYWILYTILSPPSPGIWVGDPDSYHIYRFRNDPARATSVPHGRMMLYHLLAWSFGIYTWFLMTKLRRVVRMRYEIPVRFPLLGPWEDGCLSLFCGPCVVAQLARQSCDYQVQPAACCSPTGLGQPPVLGPWMMMIPNQYQYHNKNNNPHHNIHQVTTPLMV